MKKIIDYSLLVEELKLGVIRKALEFIKNDQLPGAHHFFISFSTKNPNVSISKRLLEKYPNDMTIVLQHQFKNFATKENSFTVTLYFDNVEEQIEVPYNAIISFVDPSQKFGLHFKTAKSKTTKKETQKTNSVSHVKDNVFVLDQFRNK